MLAKRPRQDDEPELDLAIFDVEQEFAQLRVPVKQVAATRNALRNFLGASRPEDRKRRIARILPVDGEKLERWVLLDLTKEGKIPEAVKDYAEKKQYPLALTKLVLGYDTVTWHAAVKMLLPDNVEAVTSFERIGHIAHFNLLPELLPFRHRIGRICLDKHHGLRTVINKRAQLSSEFRVPDWELMAGEWDLAASLVEAGVTYHVDFGKVYWNSRLAGARDRLVQEVPENSLICDVMGGVGAFGIRLAKEKKCLVLSNDLNPAALPLLEQNAKANKIAENVAGYTEDGRDFIRRALALCAQEEIDRASLNVFKMPSEQKVAPSGAPRVHYSGVFFLLNLPEIAPEFCDAFSSDLLPPNRPINVRCYCFQSDPEDCAPTKLRFERSLKKLPADFEIRSIRSVSTSKVMVCAAFSLRREDFV